MGRDSCYGSDIINDLVAFIFCLNFHFNKKKARELSREIV